MTEMADLLRRNQINPATLDVIADTNDGRIWQLTTPGGKQAIEIWQRIRFAAEPIGHWPVVLGEPFEATNRKEVLRNSSESASDILTEAAKLDGAEVLKTRDESWRQELAELNECDPEVFLAKVGIWPNEAKPSTALTIPYNMSTRKAHPQVAMALVPTTRPWEVFAHLKFGAWNECPTPAEHVAIAQRWNRLYGAEVFGVTQDVVEMTVSRPPADRDMALALAREQYIYCIDIVEQGTGTLAKLAARRLNGKAWYFWWD
jgi:hypothetical protein